MNRLSLCSDLGAQLAYGLISPLFERGHCILKIQNSYLGIEELSLHVETVEADMI